MSDTKQELPYGWELDIASHAGNDTIEVSIDTEGNLVVWTYCKTHDITTKATIPRVVIEALFAEHNKRAVMCLPIDIEHERIVDELVEEKMAANLSKKQK